MAMGSSLPGPAGRSCTDGNRSEPQDRARADALRRRPVLRVRCTGRHDRRPAVRGRAGYFSLVPVERRLAQAC